MSLKRQLFQLLGKDPEAVVVTFLSGPDELTLPMLEEVRRLVPDREHYAVTTEPREIPGVHAIPADEARRALKRKRIGLAPVLFSGNPAYAGLRRLALRMAPHKILAYNARLERHHLRLQTAVASWLFLRGVPLDRIWLRPRWLIPWKRDRSLFPSSFQMFEGRPLQADRSRVAILSPYYPYPLSHGGAVRIFHLIREAAKHFDVFLFSFGEVTSANLAPMLELSARVVIVPNARYREPHWSTLDPPEVHEFGSPVMARVIGDLRKEFQIPLLQVEYTQMARYGGDILVEHDVTFDLYLQIHERERARLSWWNYRRWLRFEQRAVAQFPRVVVMSDKDAQLLPAASTVVIPNGVDLARFSPEPETAGQNLLFVGSFRHFPNIVAYRFFTEQVWPLLRARWRNIQLTAVTGPDADTYWREFAGGEPPYSDDQITRLGFISDVRPLYAAANVVIVPTMVSAGTNLKVLEAMAMERAVVATSSGAAGLQLEHGKSVWVADTAGEFAEGVHHLLSEFALRRQIARNARAHAEQHFGWVPLGRLQRRLWNSLLPGQSIAVREGNPSDIGAITRIQGASNASSHWDPASYLTYDLKVATLGENVVGFLVSRRVAPDEIEILNLAVDSEYRRRGAASELIRSFPHDRLFLEVRESNMTARRLYETLGFVQIGRRENYYEDPVEAALVMRY
ncbi:MAG TPA: GNAT family N-acetyltransferase [Bryobacteraceae bacterium]|nr:GNAT family N-acetyltransferase [Bryobacteraceae bacterium]